MDHDQKAIPARGLGYEALETQFNFHNSTALYKGYSGPVGSGKSYALCWEAIRLAYENPGRTGLIGAPTYPMLKDATLVALTELLRNADIPYEHNRADSVMTLSEPGSRILFRPLEEFERLRGTNLAWFGLDELTYTPEEAWTRLEARLRDPKANRLCGFGVWTPKGYDWVYRRFVTKATADYALFRATPMENSFVLARRPDFYEALKNSYDDRLYRQEALGEYLQFNGSAVYSSFDREVHIHKDTEVDEHRPLRWSLDFNVNPMCSVVAQQRRDDSVCVLDEIFLKNATTRQACMEFIDRYRRYNAEVVVHGDASGRAHHTTGYSDYNMIEECFAEERISVRIEVPKSNPPVNERVHLVNRQFRAADQAGIVVDEKCKELIADLEQVSYKGNTGDVDKDSDRMRTHMSDALGYLIWATCKTSKTIGEQPYNRLV